MSPRFFLLAIGYFPALLLSSCVTGKLQPVMDRPSPVTSPTFAAELAAVAKTPWTTGNDIRTLVNGRAFYPAMLGAIRAAKHTITFETYVAVESWQVKDFSDAFKERARAGVKVHVILDAYGCNTYGDGHLASMREAGVDVRFYNPFKVLRPLRFNHRTHRRILVVDGEVGFVGGAGLAYAWDSDAENVLRWRDTQYGLRGPVVRQLQDGFNDNWSELTGAALSGPGYYPALAPAGSVKAQMVLGSPESGPEIVGSSYLLAFRAARRSIHIAHPYFMPNHELTEALVAAAKRGVDIEILMPGEQTDMHIAMPVARPALMRFADAGIRLFVYEPTMMHGKLVVVDGYLTITGSANLDARSFFINDENNLHALSSSFATDQIGMYERDKARSRLLTRNELRLSMVRRIQGWLGRRMAAQL